MDWINFFRSEWESIRAHPASYFAAMAIAAVAAFGIASWHYSGRIDALMETLQTRQFPSPVVKTVTKAIPDPLAEQRLASDAQTISNLSALVDQKYSSKLSTTPPQSSSAQAPVSANQSGGVAQGAGSSIQTVNQNGLPARSAFAAPLGNLYTQGYLILQQVGVKNLSDSDADHLLNQFTDWRQRTVNFMNANMCSDAAAYFLKAHRTSISYGVPEKQNDLIDVISWSLDNISDIKRNDAWDCK